MRRLLYLVILLVGLLMGCGGSDGDSSGSSGAPTPVEFSIIWEGRTRSALAPASATFGRLILRNASGSEALNYPFNRPSNPVAQASVHRSGSSVAPGDYDAVFNFYGLEGAELPVASATVAVRVLSNGTLAKPDGTALGDLLASGFIERVSLVPGQSIEVGQTVDLQFVAVDASDRIIAVTHGGAEFRAPAGASFLDVKPDGSATGLAAGTVSVTVTVDGVSASGDVTVTDSSGPRVLKVDLPVNDLVYDPVRDLIYASVPGSASENPNTVIAVNPATGEVVDSEFVGSEPTELALSSDSSTLYVGLDGAGAVRRIDVSTFTAGAQFILSPDVTLYAEDLEVRPGTTDTVAVARARRGISPRTNGVGLYVNGELRSELGRGNSIVFNSNGNELYGFNNETTAFDLVKMAVSDSGLAVVDTNNTVIDRFDANITFGNGRLFSSSYDVIDPVTLARIGVLANRSLNTFRMAPSPNSNVVASVGAGNSFAAFQLHNAATFTRTDVFEIPVSEFVFGIGELVTTGPKRYAFSTETFDGPKQLIILELP